MKLRWSCLLNLRQSTVYLRHSNSSSRFTISPSWLYCFVSKTVLLSKKREALLGKVSVENFARSATDFKLLLNLFTSVFQSGFQRRDLMFKGRWKK